MPVCSEEVVAKQHAVARQRVEVRGFDMGVAEDRQALAAPLIGGDKQNIHGVILHRTSFPRKRESRDFATLSRSRGGGRDDPSLDNLTQDFSC